MRPAVCRLAAFAGAGGSALGVALTAGQGVTGQGLAGLLMPGVVVVAATAFAGLAALWFWLRVLGQPSRDLRWLLERTDSVDDAARLLELLQPFHREAVRACAGEADRAPARVRGPVPAASSLAEGVRDRMSRPDLAT